PICSACEPRSSAIGVLLARRPRLARFGSSRSRPTLWGGQVGTWIPPFRDQRLDLLGGEVVVVPVVEPGHRRVLAGAEALDALVAEQPILRNLARLANADRLPQVIDELVRAAQRARQIRAHVEPVLADRLHVEQGIEGRDP